MRNQIISSATTLILFFVILFIYTKLNGPIPFSVNSVTTNKTDTFNVTGEGKVSVKPDIALVNVGIQAEGPTVQQVQDNINSTINKVSSSIKNLGVEEKDIQTINYNINPSYDYTGRTPRITSYQANTTLSIKVRQLSNINNVIDQATAAGANQVNNITFDISDKTKAQEEARQKAVAEAKSKADAAARIAGFKLGRIINYNENFGDFPRPLPMVANALDSAKGAAETSIEPGSSDIRITVTLSYELR